MNAWLLMNTCLSLTALGAAFALRRAPARLTFFLLLGALVLWCLPLSPVVLSSGPPAMESLDLIPIGPAGSTPSILVSDAAPGVPWLWLLLAAGAAGGVVFTLRAVRSVRQARALRPGAQPLVTGAGSFPDADNPPPTWIIQGRQAFTTGVFRPSIWVGQACLDSSAARAILTHEWVHARRRDNAWLWIVELIRHVLWWNPLVWLLAREARLKLEMSCDEACEGYFEPGVYLKNIAAFFAGTNDRHRLVETSMLGGESTLTRRVRHLVSHRPLGPAHLSVLLAALLTSAAVLVQAEGPYGRSSSSSLEVEENGSYRLTLENAHPGEAVQKLASLGRVHVLAHPAVNNWRLTIVLEGTRERWIDGVEYLMTSGKFGATFGYVINEGKLLLAPKTVLATGSSEWLADALELGVLQPPPPDLNSLRVGVDVLMTYRGETFRQTGLVLSEQAWFGLRQATLGLNLRPTVLEDDQVRLDLRIDDTSTGKVLAAPTLITLSGRDAIVEIGGENPLRVEVSPTIL